MTCTTTGVEMVGTITVGPSGFVPEIDQFGDTGTIVPARSTAPFKNLAITIIPVEKTTQYTVSVYHDGELEETHTFPSAGTVVCHMSFPNLIFPANVGTNTIPKFYADSLKDYYGVPIRVSITNLGQSSATFIVYSTFEEFDHVRFASITQES